jgi:hypothetical protein
MQAENPMPAPLMPKLPPDLPDGIPPSGAPSDVVLVGEVPPLTLATDGPDEPPPHAATSSDRLAIETPRPANLNVFRCTCARKPEVSKAALKRR